MEFRFTKEQDAFRQELRSWLGEILPRFQVGRDFAGKSEVEAEDTRYSPAFSRELGKKGWIGLAWPKEYGGQGLDYVEQMIFNEEMVLNRAPCGYHLPAERQMGPSILQFGTPEQKDFFLPKIMAGEMGFAIGYTEPNTGSDLAGLRTSARQDGDDYVINGQKMWAGGAHFVDYLWTAVRTDPDAPKHRGVSVFCIPLKETPGLTIRPFHTMSGARYNEVFFDDARVPASAMIGEKDRGWYTVAHNLDFERSGIERVVQTEMFLRDVLELAKTIRHNGKPLLSNPITRHKLAGVAIELQVERNLCYRVASMQSAGLVPNYQSSMSKLFGSEVGQRACSVFMETFGLYGALERGSPFAHMRGKVLRKYLDAVASTIRGGTSEIQRNIMATRGLGLPRG
ncbi:MAG: acyl-CoA dehydrogenase family protein [Chloroflexi bacterium]|nr:acyl-CoA dehydrogenase family protein [Chloroflexota bacterium]